MGAVPGTDFLTMADAARIKGVSYHTVSRAVRRGRLPVQRLGRMALIAAADLEAWRPMTERRPRRYQRAEEGSVLHVFERAADESIDLARQYAAIVEEVLEDARSLDLATYLARCAERIAEGFGCIQVSIWSLEADGERRLALAARIRAGGAATRAGAERGEAALALGRDPALDELVANPRPRIVTALPRTVAAHLGIADRAGRTLVAPVRTFREQLGLLVAQQGIRALSDAELRVLERLLAQMAFGWEMLRDRTEREARIVALEAALDAAPVGVRVVSRSGWSLRNEQDRRFFPEHSDAATMVEAEIARTRAEGHRGGLMMQDEDGRHLDIETHPFTADASDAAGGGSPGGAIAITRDLSEAVAEHDDAERTIRALHREVESARAIGLLARRMQGAATPAAVIQQGASTIVEAVRGDGAMFELREDDGRFRRVPLGGEAEPEPSRQFHPMSYPSTVLALARRRPVLVARHLAATFEREIMEGMRWQSMLVVPLIARDEQLGFAMIGFTGDDLPERQVTELARDLAGSMADAIVAARTMERLEEHLRRVRTVLEQVPQAVLIVSGTEGALGFANPAAVDLWGWEPGRHPPSIMDLTMLDAGGAPIERDAHPLMLGIRTGRSFLGEPLTTRTRRGEVVDVLATIAPVLTPEGAIGGSVILVQERSQFRRMEEAKEAFVAMVAHELRNPVTAVMGSMQLLERRLARMPEGIDPAVRDRVAMLSRQVGMLGGLVSRLLDRSHLEFGHLDVAPVATDAVAIVQQASDDALALMGGRAIAVNAPSQLPVRWDEVRMGQVMANLLSNAARHGDGPVDVTVALREAAPGSAAGVRIVVRDRGRGIDPAIRARLASPRRHSPPAEPRPEGQGLGIGLYLSERIVAAHGGRMTMGDAEGGGAEIVLDLPAQAVTGQVSVMEGMLHYGDA